jgi:hypothetical protein
MIATWTALGAETPGVERWPSGPTGIAEALEASIPIASTINDVLITIRPPLNAAIRR